MAMEHGDAQDSSSNSGSMGSAAGTLSLLHAHAVPELSNAAASLGAAGVRLDASGMGLSIGVLSLLHGDAASEPHGTAVRVIFNASGLGGQSHAAGALGAPEAANRGFSRSKTGVARMRSWGQL